MRLLPWFHRDPIAGSRVASLAAILSDKPVSLPQEVAKRCQALEALSGLGAEAHSALPAILRSLWVKVDVDCGLCLRIAAAEAAWKVGGLVELALPILAWGLKDEYWEASRKAVKTLGEMGLSASDASPELMQLAHRLLASGRLGFDDPTLDRRPLLAEVAETLGKCGRGPCWSEVYGTLLHIAECDDASVREAAASALVFLGNPVDGVQAAKPVKL